MKILCIEDGSVDIEDLQDLKDGGVIVYRQGSTPPCIIDFGVNKESEKPKTEDVLKSFATQTNAIFQRLALDCHKEVVDKALKEYREVLKVYRVELKDKQPNNNF